MYDQNVYYLAFEWMMSDLWLLIIQYLIRFYVAPMQYLYP